LNSPDAAVSFGACDRGGREGGMSGADGRRGREVVGVFSDGYALESAVNELLNSGFDLGDISLLAGEEAVVAKLGHKYEKVEDVEDDDQAPRVAYVPRESRGVIGAEVGGLIGAVLGEFMEERHAKYLQEQLDHGGLLLWVRTRDSAQEEKAKQIIAQHSGRDVHAHDAPVAAA
jgi:hypothetical protein